MSMAQVHEDRVTHLLIWSLQVGVTLEQSKLAREPWKAVASESERAKRELRTTVPQLTEIICGEVPLPKKALSAAVARLVREVALSSFQPGGAIVHGEHFERLHPGAA